MIKLLKVYKKFIFILILPYLAVLFVLVYPTNKSVTAPGGLTPVEAFVEIEGYELSDDFYTVYVYHYYPITIFQSWVLAHEKTMDINEMTIIEEQTTLSENYVIGQLAKDVSIKRSIISAYDLAKEVNDEIVLDYHFGGLLVRRRPNSDSELKIGDLITKINGIGYENLNPLDFYDLISDGSNTFTINKSDQEYDVTYQYQEGDLPLGFYAHYVIDDIYPSYQLLDDNTYVGGPSGGLLQALNIYVSLANINIEGLKISGTGTIDVDGTVGEIGGLVQKIYTAIEHDVDLFFYPISQTDELHLPDYPYQIIPVNNLSEAVNTLYDILDE